MGETAENLVHRGFDVILVEMGDQILAPLDPEMAHIVEGYVERHGIRLALNDGVAGFKQAANGAVDVLTKSGKSYPADIVILALGVRPDTTLAKMAGLKIGERGGSASTSTCARATRISSPSATPSKSRTS
jgi:NADPH-dependent 2,4-dienoyl-CoA reductase/sulfur reductase-like enzyme